MNWKNITFDFWMFKGNTRALANTFNRWFLYAKTLLIWPANQLDIDKATIFMVDMIAWERDVHRFNDEPESLYRKRVKYAYVNARDAGSVAGFKRIWHRVGLGDVVIEERVNGWEWDVVLLSVDAESIAKDSNLMNILIEKYGRTCRRYLVGTLACKNISIQSATFDFNCTYVTAESEFSGELTRFVKLVDGAGNLSDGLDLLVDEVGRIYKEA